MATTVYADKKAMMMEKAKVGLEKVCSVRNVVMEPIKWNGLDTGKMAIANEERTELYSVVGERYCPITHAEVYGRVTEWLGGGQVVNVLHGGFHELSRAVISIDLNKPYSVGGQEISTFVNIYNSMDGGWCVGVKVMPVRVFCTNQFRLLMGNVAKKQAFIQITAKHLNDRVAQFRKDIQLLEMVDAAMDEQIALANELTRKVMPTAIGAKKLEQLKEQKRITEKLADEAMALWIDPIRKADENRDAWTLFNCLTEPLNRKLEDKGKLSTLEEIDRVGELVGELMHA